MWFDDPSLTSPAARRRRLGSGNALCARLRGRARGLVRQLGDQGGTQNESYNAFAALEEAETEPPVTAKGHAEVSTHNDLEAAFECLSESLRWLGAFAEVVRERIARVVRSEKQTISGDRNDARVQTMPAATPLAGRRRRWALRRRQREEEERFARDEESEVGTSARPG